MLSVAIEPLKLELFNAFKSQAVSDALTRALLSTFDKDAQNNPDFFEIAQGFGQVAAAYLAPALAKPVADAIDKYVKQIEFVITPTKLTSPVGPVTGVINSKPDIQIL